MFCCFIHRRLLAFVDCIFGVQSRHRVEVYNPYNPKHCTEQVQSQHMAFTQSPSLSNNLKILTNYLICTDTEQRMPEDRSKRDRIENWGRRRDHEIKECQTTLHQIAHPACNPQSGNQGQQDVYVRKRSNSAISKEEKVPYAFTREGSLCQIGWIFGKIPNSLRPSPLIFEKLCCNFFTIDLVAYMQGGMLAR